MVGYSAVTQKNEALALELLEAHRKLLRPIFSIHGGREIETAGDLFLVEFDSAVESVMCAIEIQETLFKRNASLGEDHRIMLRIGIHIGDVVFHDNHVHGDGVNLAARIQPLAPPGGIVVSEDVVRQIRNKVDCAVISMGPQKLKNISTRMEVFQVRLPWEKQVNYRIRTSVRKLIVPGVVVVMLAISALAYFSLRKTNPLAGLRLRIAVLPLENIGEDEQNEYFADGMTEELISSLSKINNLHVIARSSIMKYKNAPKGITEIGEELNVGTILEGAVRRSGNKARITVQLIDVLTQEHIWSTGYDRDIQDIFVIQSEIAQHVASKLKVLLASSEKTQLEKNGTTNSQAFEEYLIGKHYVNARTSASIHTAVTHLERSVAYDPEFALAWSELSYCYALLTGAGFGTLPGGNVKGKAKEAVMKALEIDQTLAEAHAALGYITFRVDWNWQQADQEFRRAIELKPGYSTSHEWYALFLAINKRFDEALTQINIARELDPMSLAVNNGLGRIYHYRGEMDKAESQLKKTIALDPSFGEAWFSLGMAYYKMKKYDLAETQILKALDLTGRRPVMVGLLGSIYAQNNKMKEANELLREMQGGETDYDKMYARCFILMGMQRFDEAFALLDKLIAIRYGMMIYLNVEQSYFKNLDVKMLQQILTEMQFARD